MPALPWRLLLTGRSSGALNMALDEALLLCSAERPAPTLRLYGWEPPCVSIGYFQRAGEGIDRKLLAQRGWHLVRRSTGGRALLHADELTYSVVLAPHHPLSDGGVLRCYRRLSAALIRGLARLGICADEPRRAADARRLPPSVACFQSTSPYEITVGGRKIAGSAQVRRGGAVLQHGSLLLSLRPEAGDWMSDASSPYDGRATSVAQVLGRNVGFDEAAEALRRGFEEALAIELAPGSPTEEELLLAQRLADEKYSRDEWNLRC